MSSLAVGICARDRYQINCGSGCCGAREPVAERTALLRAYGSRRTRAARACGGHAGTVSRFVIPSIRRIRPFPWYRCTYTEYENGHRATHGASLYRRRGSTALMLVRGVSNPKAPDSNRPTTLPEQETHSVLGLRLSCCRPGVS